jgi:ABC-2 type transport system ATP-binding protein
VVQTRDTERQTSLLVRANSHLFDTSWQVNDVDLEEIVLAYFARPPSRGAVLMTETQLPRRPKVLT